MEENKFENNSSKQWFIVTTIPGQEEKVKVNIEQRINNAGLNDLVLRTLVPIEKVRVKDKNGLPAFKKNKETGEQEPKFKEVILYPGYIFVECFMTDKVWYEIRNTPLVTGITGSSGHGQKPIPVTSFEMESVLKRMGLVDSDMYENYHTGDIVKIISGTFKDVEGKIIDINKEKGLVKIDTIFFGRHTPVEVEFSEIVHA